MYMLFTKIKKKNIGNVHLTQISYKYSQHILISTSIAKFQTDKFRIWCE